VSPDLELALRLADAADELSLARFRALDLKVETKPDMTPVTEADKAVERRLREALAVERPDDAIVGEEEGGDATGASRRWILDPIDGTKHYSRGVPVFATLIALEADGEVALGVVSAPALGRRWWAERGGGAFANGDRLAVSRIGRLEDAIFSRDRATNGVAASYEPALKKLDDRCWARRGFGDFWQHILVAEGSVDVAIDPVMNLWDIAALLPIIEEAGGRLTNLAGERDQDGGSAVSTNGLLHAEVLAALDAEA
jgi:histidinol-phosphatase